MLPIIAVSVLGAGTGAVGVINSLGLAAFLLLSLPIGLLADRRGSPTTFMAGSSLVRAVMLLSAVVVWLAGGLEGYVGLVILMGMAAVIGVADVVFTTGQALLVPQLVGERRIREVYGRLQAFAQAGGTAAPTLVAGLLVLVSAPWAWVGAGVAYLCSLTTQRKIGHQEHPSKPAERTSAWADVAAGIRLLMRRPLLARITIANVLNNAAVMAANTLLPVIALRELALDPAVFAGVAAMAAVSGILGAGLAARLSARLGLRAVRLIVALAMAMASAAVVLVLMGVMPGPAEGWLMLQAGVAGAGSSIALVAGADLVPRLVSARRLGTVMGAQRSVVLGVMPVAALTFGGLANVVGIVPMAWVWVALVLCSALPCLGLTEPEPDPSAQSV